jgi:phage shock protein PspC (stress-responsive transcriptional regulator)
MNKKTLGIIVAGAVGGVAVAYAISPDRSHDVMVYATFASGFSGAGVAYLLYYFGPRILHRFRKD